MIHMNQYLVTNHYCPWTKLIIVEILYAKTLNKLANKFMLSHYNFFNVDQEQNNKLKKTMKNDQDITQNKTGITCTMHMNYPQPLSVLLKGCISRLFVLKDHPLQSFQLPQHLLYALHFCPFGIYNDNIYSTTFYLVGI